MTDIPHLSFPFQWSNNGHARELEQDTDDQIMNCVDLICSVNIGSLVDQTDFGITDPTFTISPDPVLLQHQIEQWEPRAKVGVTFFNTGDGSELDMEVSVKTGGQNG